METGGATTTSLTLVASCGNLGQSPIVVRFGNPVFFDGVSGIVACEKVPVFIGLSRRMSSLKSDCVRYLARRNTSEAASQYCSTLLEGMGAIICLDSEGWRSNNS